MENEKLGKKVKKEHKILAKNSIYAFLVTYSNYIGSVLTSFLLARLITPYLWGILILGISYTTISSLILGFLPPGLGASLNYYIPKYYALNQINKLKSYIKITIYIQTIAVIFIFFISMVIYFLFADLFRINLGNYVQILYIMAPIIILNGLYGVFNDIIRGLNFFNLVFFLNVLKYAVNITLLFCLFFFTSVQIEIIALINIISILIPFIINCGIIFFIFRFKLKKTDESKLTFKNVIKDSSIYGIHIDIQSFINKLFTEIRTIGVGTFTSPDIVTGYNIANHYREVSTGSVSSLNKPLIISFTGLYAKNQHDQITKIYKILFKYTSFFLLLTTGILFYFTDFYLFLIYGSSYLDYSILVNLILFSVIFYFQRNFFFSLLRSSEKVKLLVPISLFFSILNITSFFIGLIYFGIIGAIIGSIISAILNFILSIFLCYKFFKIVLNIRQFFLLYSLFFLTLIITFLISNLILNNLNNWILQALNLEFFQKLNLFSISFFIFTFISLIFVFKILKRSDIEILEAFFVKDKFVYRSIRRILNFLKKFTRK